MSMKYYFNLTNSTENDELNIATVVGFIFVDTNFCGLNENDTFVGFKICGQSVVLHYSY